MDLSVINYYISSFYYKQLQIINLFIIFISIFQNNFLWRLTNCFIIYTNSTEILIIKDNENDYDYNNILYESYIIYNIYHFIAYSLFLTSFLDIIYGNFYWVTIALLLIKYFFIYSYQLFVKLY